MWGQQFNPFYSQQGFNQAYGNMLGMNNLYNQQANSGLFGMGMQNLQNAGDQSALYNQQLGTLRQAAAPELNRQTNALTSRLYNMGMLGGNSTATGEAFRGLFEAQGAQDLGFQNQAFSNAYNQQQFLGNLGINQLNAQNMFGQGAMQSGLYAGQMEGQGYNQMTGALQNNQVAGANRLAAAQGLFGFGTDLYSNAANMGYNAGMFTQNQNQNLWNMANQQANTQIGRDSGAMQPTGNPMIGGMLAGLGNSIMGASSWGGSPTGGYLTPIQVTPTQRQYYPGQS